MFVLHETRSAVVTVPGCGASWLTEIAGRRSDYESVDRQEGFESYEWHRIVADPVERFHRLWRHRVRGIMRDRPNRGDAVPIAPGLECVGAIFGDWDLFTAWFVKQPLPRVGQWRPQSLFGAQSDRLWLLQDLPTLAHSLDLPIGVLESEPSFMPNTEGVSESQARAITDLYAEDRLLPHVARTRRLKS